MQIHVNGKGFELKSALKNDITNKIDRSFGPFAERIVKVNACLEDVNGPKHGVDKRLRLVIAISRLPLVVIEEKGEAWRALIDQSVERAFHAIARQIDRRRSHGNRTRLTSEVS